ncbi:alpha/beta hydrolase [Pelomonas sp. P7]|uniref:Alpha/beta hydrolase n=1 Tax=Pelomonas caseinilytica TaxID=2906763 RepID=A0ABS8XI21_9BURK|nr:alpha/beta hydrolase [Pelomonas sp. P7]MCE4540499.1 alpha/beta hydrolase [Pelomonas sp. P7]
MKHFDRYYTSDDGLRLYCRDYPGPTADAPVLVCLPGLTRNSKDFAALAEALSEHCRVLCPDMRGRGRSARDPDPSRYRPDRYCADMLTLLDLLGIPRVGLIGTSLGGLMAMTLAALRPALVGPVVLNDVGPELDPRGIDRIKAYLSQPQPPAAPEVVIARLARINADVFPDYGPDDWRALAMATCVIDGDLMTTDVDPAIAQNLVGGAELPNLWPLFGLLAGRPVLVVRGERSDVLSAAAVQRMAGRLPGMQTLEVPGRGHAPTLDEPQVREGLWAFLAQAWAG